MAKADFYLVFGSNAKEFGTELKRDLAGAQEQLGSFAREARAINAAINQRTGGQGFLGITQGLHDANRLISSLTEELGRMKGEFSRIISTLQGLSNIQSIPQTALDALPASAPARRATPQFKGEGTHRLPTGDFQREIDERLQLLADDKDVLTRALKEAHERWLGATKEPTSGSRRPSKEGMQDVVAVARYEKKRLRERLQAVRESTEEQHQQIDQVEEESEPTTVKERRDKSKKKSRKAGEAKKVKDTLDARLETYLKKHGIMIDELISQLEGTDSINVINKIAGGQGLDLLSKSGGGEKLLGQKLKGDLGQRRKILLDAIKSRQSTLTSTSEDVEKEVQDSRADLEKVGEEISKERTEAWQKRVDDVIERLGVGDEQALVDLIKSPDTNINTLRSIAGRSQGLNIRGLVGKGKTASGDAIRAGILKALGASQEQESQQETASEGPSDAPTDGLRELLRARNNELRKIATRTSPSTTDKAKLRRMDREVEKAKQERLDAEKKASEEDLAAFRELDREPASIEDNRQLQREFRSVLQSRTPRPESEAASAAKTASTETTEAAKEEIRKRTEEQQRLLDAILSNLGIDEQELIPLLEGMSHEQLKAIAGRKGGKASSRLGYARPLGPEANLPGNFGDTPEIALRAAEALREISDQIKERGEYRAHRPTGTSDPEWLEAVQGLVDRGLLSIDRNEEDWDELILRPSYNYRQPQVDTALDLLEGARLEGQGVPGLGRGGQAAIAAAEGDIEGAAELLGVSADELRGAMEAWVRAWGMGPVREAAGLPPLQGNVPRTGEFPTSDEGFGALWEMARDAPGQAPLLYRVSEGGEDQRAVRAELKPGDVVGQDVVGPGAVSSWTESWDAVTGFGGDVFRVQPGAKGTPIPAGSQEEWLLSGQYRVESVGPSPVDPHHRMYSLVPADDPRVVEDQGLGLGAGGGSDAIRQRIIEALGLDLPSPKEVVEAVQQETQEASEHLDELKKQRDAANELRKTLGQKSPGTSVRDGRFHKREGEWEYRDDTKEEFKAADEEYKRLDRLVKAEEAKSTTSPKEDPAEEVLETISEDEAEQVEEVVEQAQEDSEERLAAIKERQKALKNERRTIAWQKKKGARWKPKPGKGSDERAARLKQIKQELDQLDEEYKEANRQVKTGTPSEAEEVEAAAEASADEATEEVKEALSEEASAEQEMLQRVLGKTGVSKQELIDQIHTKKYRDLQRLAKEGFELPAGGKHEDLKARLLSSIGAEDSTPPLSPEETETAIQELMANRLEQITRSFGKMNEQELLQHARAVFGDAATGERGGDVGAGLDELRQRLIDEKAASLEEEVRSQVKSGKLDLRPDQDAQELAEGVTEGARRLASAHETIKAAAEELQGIEFQRPDDSVKEAMQQWRAIGSKRARNVRGMSATAAQADMVDPGLDLSPYAAAASRETAIELARFRAIVEDLQGKLAAAEKGSAEEGVLRSLLEVAETRVREVGEQFEFLYRGEFDTQVEMLESFDRRIDAAQSALRDKKLQLGTGDFDADERRDLLTPVLDNLREAKAAREEFANNLANKFPVEALTSGADLSLPEELRTPRKGRRPATAAQAERAMRHASQQAAEGRRPDFSGLEGTEGTVFDSDRDPAMALARFYASRGEHLPSEQQSIRRLLGITGMQATPDTVKTDRHQLGAFLGEPVRDWQPDYVSPGTDQRALTEEERQERERINQAQREGVGEARELLRALQVMEKIDAENLEVQRRRRQIAVRAMNALVTEMPEASEKEIRATLKAQGIGKQERNTMMAALKDLDEAIIQAPEGLSAARVRGAQVRGGRAWERQEQRQEWGAQMGGRTPEVDLLRPKHRLQRKLRDLGGRRGAISEAFFSARQSAGESRGTLERTFELGEYQERAQTTTEFAALDRFRNELDQWIEGAAKVKPPSLPDTLQERLEKAREEGKKDEAKQLERMAGADPDRLRTLRGQAAERGDEEMVAALDELIAVSSEVAAQETRAYKNLIAKWEQLQSAFDTSSDPEIEQRLKKEREEEWAREMARKELNLRVRPVPTLTRPKPHVVAENLGYAPHQLEDLSTEAARQAARAQAREAAKERAEAAEIRARQADQERRNLAPLGKIVEETGRVMPRPIGDPDEEARRAADLIKRAQAAAAMEEQEARFGGLGAKKPPTRGFALDRDVLAAAPSVEMAERISQLRMDAAIRPEDILPDVQVGLPVEEQERLNALQQQYEQSVQDANAKWRDVSSTLKDLTSEELKEHARDLEIPGRSKMRKADLVEAITARDEEVITARSRREEAKAELDTFSEVELGLRPGMKSAEQVIPVDPSVSREYEELRQRSEAARAELARLNDELAAAAKTSRAAKNEQAEAQNEVAALMGAGERPEILGEKAQELARIVDILDRISSGEITDPAQVPGSRIAEFGLEGLGVSDIERSLHLRKRGLIMQEFETTSGFDPQDRRFADPTMPVEEFLRRFAQFADEWARGGGSVEAEQAALEERIAQEEAPKQALIEERAQKILEEARAKEAAAERKARGGPAGSFEECCERIVQGLEKIYRRLSEGVRLTGASARAMKPERGDEIEAPASTRVDPEDHGLPRTWSPVERSRWERRRQSPEARIDRRSLEDRGINVGEWAGDANDLLPEELVRRAAEFAGYIERVTQYDKGESVHMAASQFGLGDKEGLAAIRREIRDARERERQLKADAEKEGDNKNQRERVELTKAESAILAQLNKETQEAIAKARELRRAKGADSEEAMEAVGRAAVLIDRNYDQFAGPGGRKLVDARGRKQFEQAVLQVGERDLDYAKGQELLMQQAEAIKGAARKEGPRVQDTISNAFFGESGFASRIMRSTGTFIVRNFTSRLVFGISRLFTRMIKEAIQTEAQFIRVSDALEATGRSAGGVRTELMSISTDLGRPLQEIYEIAANITGAFEDVRDVEFGTRIVAQLELISNGALKAKDGFDALQTVAAAFELEGVRELERIQDTAVAIQNVMAIGIDDTIQGIGGMAGQAAELNMSLEQTAVLVAAVAKGTNQSGRAAAEQFGRILSTFETSRGRSTLLEAGIGDRGMFAEGEIGSVIFDMIEKWDQLTEAQQRNLKSTFGSRREARAFNALINRREQILQTLIETENAHGLGQRRVEEVMRELAYQVQIASANFTNLGAVLVRSGILDFFQLMLRGWNSVLGGVNEFFSVLNDFADNNAFGSWVRSSTMMLFGLLATMRMVGSMADMMAVAIGRQAAAAGTLQAAMTLPFLGRRIAAQQSSGAIKAAAQTGQATGRGGMLAGAIAGSLGATGRRAQARTLVPVGGTSATMMRGRAPHRFRDATTGRFASRDAAAQAGLIDPLTGVLLGIGARGMLSSAGRGASRIGGMLHRQGTALGGYGVRTARIGVTGAGAATRGAAARGIAAQGAGAAMAKLGIAIGGLGPKAWVAAAAIAAIGTAVTSLVGALGATRDRERTADDLLVPLMSDDRRMEAEEEERRRNLSLLRRRTERGKNARAEAQKERFDELQEMDPGERALQEAVDSANWFENLGVLIDWERVLTSGWSEGVSWDPLESYLSRMYDEEIERLQEGVRIGDESIREYQERLEGMMEEDGLREDAFEGTRQQDEAVGMNRRMQEEAERTFEAQADALKDLRDTGLIDRDEYLSRTSALVDTRRKIIATHDRIERRIMGLIDVDELLADELSGLLGAVSALEGISGVEAIMLPDVLGALDSLHDEIGLEGSSWNRYLNLLRDQSLTDFERAEEYQQARKDALKEAQRLLKDASVTGEPEDLKQAEQEVSQLAQQVAQGHRQLWELARQRSDELSQIAVELGGAMIDIANEALGRTIDDIHAQIEAFEKTIGDGGYSDLAHGRTIDPRMFLRPQEQRQELFWALIERQRETGAVELAEQFLQADVLEAGGAEPVDVAGLRVQAEERRLRALQAVARENERMYEHWGAEETQALLRPAVLALMEEQQRQSDAIEQMASAELQFAQTLTEDPRLQAMLELEAATQAHGRMMQRGAYSSEEYYASQARMIEARRSMRDSIDGVLNSEMELALAATRDPHQQALIRLRGAAATLGLYADSDDPGRIASAQAALLNAEEELLQQARQERDARAQTQIAMQRDPEIQLMMEMQLARTQMIEAASQGQAAYEQARQNLLRIEQSLEDARNQIRLQQFQTRISLTEDPLQAAVLQIESAREQMRQAIGRADRLSAVQAIVDARRAEVDAITAIAESQLDLASAIAGATGNQIDVARIQLEAARRRLRDAQDRGAGQAAVAAARAQIIQAEAGMRDAVLQDQLDTIEFNREMGVITQGQAIQALQTILNEMDLTRDQRRQLVRQIKGLQDDLRNQIAGSGFNIPTEIDLPTAYQVRRSLGIDEMKSDRLPDEWSDLSLSRVDIDEDLTKPLSDYTQAWASTGDEIVDLARKDADRAIEAVLKEYRSLGPKMDASLRALEQSHEEAWKETHRTVTLGASRANAISVGVISELPPALKAELAQIESEHAAAWAAAQDASDVGSKGVVGTVIGNLRDGLQEVMTIMGGYSEGIAAALNPLLELVGLPTIQLGKSSGGHGSPRPSVVREKGGFGPGDEWLPPSARIQAPHGSSGLVQWAEQSTHGEAFIPLNPANRPRSLAIWEETGRRLGVTLDQFRAGGFTSQDIGRARAFATSQAGKPYLWGGVGPAGYDCSGIWSAVTNVLNRRTNPHQRLFATSSFSGQLPAGFERGLGLVSVGVVQGSPGHMSGTLAGLDVESRSGDGVVIGGKARSATDPLYTHQFYLGKGGGGGGLGAFEGMDWLGLPEIPNFPDGTLGALGEYAALEMRRLVQEVVGNLFDQLFGVGAGDFMRGSNASEGESGTLQSMVKRALAERGWSQHWPALNQLIQHESSWNPNGQNPNSSAYGLFQFLDSTWAGTGIPKTSNPSLQIEAGLRYIEARYGNPTAAWQHWLARVPINGRDMGHWYRSGGIFDEEAIIGVGEAGPEAVIPLDARGARFMASLLDETASRVASRAGVSADTDVRQFMRELGRAAVTNNTGSADTRINIENTFHQSVQSPAQIQQIAREVINLLGRQMSGSGRSSQITPHLVRT